MVSKKTFFKGLNRSRRFHPSRTLAPSKIFQPSPRVSTEVIENLKPDEVAVIDYSLVPYGSREGPDATDKTPMFLKGGGTPLEIRTETSFEAAREAKKGPTRRRIESYEEADQDLIASGITWYCLRDKTWRRVTNNDVLEGHEIFAFSELESQLRQPTKKNMIHSRVYGIDRDNREVGAVATVQIPSRSTDQSYRVKLHGIPFLGSDEHIVWQSLKSDHSDCGSKDFGDVYWKRNPQTGRRRKQRDVVFCPHDVAAYLAVSQAERIRVMENSPQVKRKITLQPFPLFTQRTVDMWNKLRTQTFFGHPDSARPLKDHEIEIELGRFLSRNPEGTMYADRRLRDYDWNKNTPVTS
ncbi:hypothetical protein HOF78_01450 [Candidatus Woesearchaeota archaeon]|jgi:hypothetical protein|nr:hypothetical protein [Candidatus Woesearchaeota archaeon]MBT6045166.1 hypothetical protein [Candidatus Woesearchaeota archaeon]